jgi:hypothetical protein
MPYDAEVDACIEHLQQHSPHYFSVVKAKRQDGVLWAVFTAAGGASLGARVTVKRASFLPLTTVLNTNAPSLIQMFNTCDQAKQFVCWFTVEGPDGQPVVSKVMTVDNDANTQIAAKNSTPGATVNANASAASSPPQHTPRPQYTRPRGSSRIQQPQQQQHPQQQLFMSPPSSASAAASPSREVSQLKAEMESFHRQQQAGTARGGAVSSRASSVGAGAGGTATSNGHGGGGSVNGQEPGLGATASNANDLYQRALQSAMGGSKTPRPSRAASPTATVVGTTTAQQQYSYSQVLRVSMQVADSVAAMGGAIEDLRGEVDTLRHAQQTAPKPPPPDVFAAVLNRLDAMERRQEELSNRVESFDDIQRRFFEQVEQIREQLRGDVSRGGRLSAEQREREEAVKRRLDEPISYRNLLEERSKRESAAVAGVPLPRVPGRQSPTRLEVAARISSAAVLAVDPPQIESEGYSSGEEAAGHRGRMAPPQVAAAARSTRGGGDDGGENAMASADVRHSATTPTGGGRSNVRTPVGDHTSSTQGGGGSYAKAMASVTSAAASRTTSPHESNATARAPSSLSATHLPRANGGNANTGTNGANGRPHDRNADAEAQDDESLSDMIKSMERKLSRIALPTGHRK